ncbi:hypothetical protein HJG60_007727 [Phyllostomus discolor]|uniref:Uncharacterized protein n=1 Tax=Phyllostomus discolor TaxID=89673 RepID=A0A834BHB9_9CHIR|nr:hypothetical protein HJG60_007727 [Phyllostomus discolor]
MLDPAGDAEKPRPRGPLRTPRGRLPDWAPRTGAPSPTDAGRGGQRPRTRAVLRAGWSGGSEWPSPDGGGRALTSWDWSGRGRGPREQTRPPGRACFQEAPTAARPEQQPPRSAGPPGSPGCSRG